MLVRVLRLDCFVCVCVRACANLLLASPSSFADLRVTHTCHKHTHAHTRTHMPAPALVHLTPFYLVTLQVGVVELCMLARTSRALYVLSHDPELWRAAVLRFVWCNTLQHTASLCVPAC